MQERQSRIKHVASRIGWVAGEGLLAATVTIGSTLAIRPNNTARIYEALVHNQRIDCGHDVKPSNKDGKDFDAIAVPGAGRFRTGGLYFEPNNYGQVRLSAAALAFNNGLAPKIILLYGKDTTGESHLTAEMYLREQLRELGWNPDDRYEDPTLSEFKSINTATNMEELAKIKDENGMKKIAVMTNVDHLGSLQYACANGVHASPIAAEEYLEKYYPFGNNEQRDKKLKEAIERVVNDGKSNKEKVRLILALFDPKGQMTTVVKRLHDDPKNGVKTLAKETLEGIRRGTR